LRDERQDSVNHSSRGRKAGRLAVDRPDGASRKDPRAMSRSLKNFLSNESGATAIEYGLIASLVALTIITAVSTLGNKLSKTFTEITSNLK
jgi:pilus assembly protein Flp/PilA